MQFKQGPGPGGPPAAPRWGISPNSIYFMGDLMEMGEFGGSFAPFSGFGGGNRALAGPGRR